MYSEIFEIRSVINISYLVKSFLRVFVPEESASCFPADERRGSAGADFAGAVTITGETNKENRNLLTKVKANILDS